MAKFMIYFLVFSIVLCLVVNVVAFFAEKRFKKKTVERVAKKEE